MTEDSIRPAPRTRSKTILTAVLAISIAWLASKAAVKAVILGPPVVAGAVIWLRQRYKKPAPPHPEDEQQTSNHRQPEPGSSD
ncbi:hypothetical protein [Streptomyces violascens]|uniref:hypothetical protein n=1 Tax=Streptomyces violascens TaxID=67381 RepID=UPI00369C7CD2